MAAGPRAIGGAKALVAALLIVLAPLAAAAQGDILRQAASAGGDGGAGAEGGGPGGYWFEVESLNPGLGPAPDGLDRATPQGALAAFLRAARDRNWQRAAHYLDLTELSPARQAREGPSLARRLAEVVQRKVWIDWDALADRPDALVEKGGASDPMVGQPRRSQRLGVVEAEGRPTVVRLNRLKPRDGPPVWVFAASTVDRVPALYRAHGPSRLERALPAWWRAPAGETALRRWELVALPICLGLTLLLFFALRGAFGWLAHRAPSAIARKAAGGARTPVALAVAAGAALSAMDRVVTFSPPVSGVVSPVLLGLVILGVTLAGVRAVDGVLDVVTRRYIGDIGDDRASDQRQLYTSLYAFRRIILLAAVAVAAGLLLVKLPVTEQLGVSLLASAGVLTVLLGIAGRAVLGNILASLQIAISKPIRIGDCVIYEDRWAYVDAIFYTFVRLRTWDNRRFVVPVTYFIAEPFENLSMEEAKMTWTFELVLDHRADPQALRDAFERIAAEDEDAMPDEITMMLVSGHDFTGQRLRFYATAPDPSTAWVMHARLRENVLGWVRAHHPEWWPRERELQAGRPETGADESAQGEGDS